MAWTKPPSSPVAPGAGRGDGQPPPGTGSGQPRHEARAAAGGGEVGGELLRPPDHVLPQPAGALLRLLQAAAVSARPGWPHLLYAWLLHVLHTFSASLPAVSSLRHGLRLLESGQPAVRAVADSSFFGLTFALRWLTLTTTLLWGRRRFAAELDQVLVCLQQISGAGPPGLTAPLRRTRRLAAALWLVMIGLAVGAAWAIRNYTPFSSQTWSGLLLSWLARLGYVVVVCCFQLVSVKFLFVGQLISAGLETVNAELGALADGERPAERWQLERLTEIRGRLTGSFTRLTDHMRAELMLSMSAGVLLLVCLFPMPFWSDEAYALMVTMLLYTTSMIVTLAGPCEAGQQVLQVTAASRRLLLQLESRCPQLAQQAALAREAAGQDLESLGDLGLYRLQRSTLLSLVSTILTYVIVMLQFVESGPDLAAAGGPIGNITK